MTLDCRGRALVCEAGTQVHAMGILNVTPDSFSDGGRFTSVDAALTAVDQMLKDGAAIIDVGGESTRPRGKAYGAGASVVTAEEEIRRVVPVIEGIVQRFPEALISIDTYKGEVARAALRAGAHIVNDVTGLRHGIGTARAAADFGAPLIVMHALGKPGEMPHEHVYGDVANEVLASLRRSVQTAQDAGVTDVVIDPGFGFGKSEDDNLRLVASAETFMEMGVPVLVGISRKSTVGKLLGTEERPVPVHERLFGTLGLTAIAVMNGATLVRTHDVKETAQLLTAITATNRAAQLEGAR